MNLMVNLRWLVRLIFSSGIPPFETPKSRASNDVPKYCSQNVKEVVKRVIDG